MIFLLFSLKCDDREGHRFCEVDTETIFTVALFNQRYWAIKWRGRFFNNGRFLYYTIAPKEKGIHGFTLVCLYVCPPLQKILSHFSEHLFTADARNSNALFFQAFHIGGYIFVPINVSHSRRIYKYCLRLTNITVDLSVQTIVLVTVATCEIHVKTKIN